MSSGSTSFIDEIDAFIKSGKVALPVFNPNALKIQQELVKAEPDRNLIEKLISSDQALSSEVLRLSNSPYYKGLVEVKTVKAAIIRLGVNEINRIVLLAASSTPVVSKDKELRVILRKLWQHSAGNAMAASWIAKRCNFESLAGQAFFAGLLHDIGKLFLISVIEQANLRKGGKMTEALLMEILDTLHTKEGYNLMKLWNMPEEYCIIARDHHDDEVDIRNTLLIMVRLADMACHKLSIGLSLLEDMNLAATVEADLLDLSEIDLAELEIMLEDTKALTA
jgi:HD-like signal output (HDOD) protein